MNTPTPSRRVLAPAAMAAAVLASGCAHVNQESLDAQLAAVRADLTHEIREGDESVRAEMDGRLDGVNARLAALRADLEILERDFEVRVEELEAAVRFDVPVYFDFDDATVAPRGRAALDRFGDVVARHYEGALLTVEGFTDPAGSAAYNLRLGQSRADAVKEYLVAGGLPADRIRTVSYGEDTSRLVAAGAQGPGTSGWENRRVVIVLDQVAPTAPVVAPETGGER